MSRHLSLGWKKDRPDDRDHDALKAGLISATAASPSEVTNDDLAKLVDQGGAGTCTANSTGQAVRAAELLEVVDADRQEWIEAGNNASDFDAVSSLARAQASLEFWARLFPYYLARAYDHATQADGGTEIRLIFKAINKFGYPPESAWPYSDDTKPGAPLFRMPSSEAFRQAYDQRASADNQQKNLIEYARITSTGDRRIDDIKAASAQRHLVVFGTLVTNRFCSDLSANGGAPIARPTSATKDIAGGHAMCMGGYDDDGPKVINSWGPEFNPDGAGNLPVGWCRFGWDYVTWDETTDLWIVRRAPLYRKAA